MKKKRAQKPAKPKYAPIDITDMCAEMPRVFHINTAPRSPSQTLEQRAARATPKGQAMAVPA